MDSDERGLAQEDVGSRQKKYCGSKQQENRDNEKYGFEVYHVEPSFLPAGALRRIPDSGNSIMRHKRAGANRYLADLLSAHNLIIFET